MSRSYKKKGVAVTKVGDIKPIVRRVTRAKLKDCSNVPLGKSNIYKKHYEYMWTSDKIADTSLMSKQEVIKQYEIYSNDVNNKDFLKKYPTVKDYIRMWKKYYKRK